MAEEPVDPKCQALRDPADNAWLLTHCFKIIMMQAGFAVLESSFVRNKNSANIMLKNVADLCVGSLGFWASGWALAFGVDKHDPSNVNAYWGTGQWFEIQNYDYASWMFHLSFASTAATIDSGAVAERMNFKPYIVYSTIMTAFLYPIACHWVWDEHGWLHKMGFHDFAGSGPVHLMGGTSALVAAWFIGPRLGRFARTGELSLRVLTAHKLQLKELDAAQPYVVVKQLNHGSGEVHTRQADNGPSPRWDQTVKLEVTPTDSGDEHRLNEDQTGLFYVHWLSEHQVEESGGVVFACERGVGDSKRASLGGSSRRSSILGGTKRPSLEVSPSGSPQHRSPRANVGPMLRISPSAHKRWCTFTSSGVELRQIKSSWHCRKIPFRMMEKIEWLYVNSAFRIYLSDVRCIELACDDSLVCAMCMRRLKEGHKPSISPQRVSIEVFDHESELLIGSGEIAIRASDKHDPEKFRQRSTVHLKEGGSVELIIAYTSPERRTQEIFQSCDPPRLLFGTLILWINWYSFNVGSTLRVTSGGAETAGRVAVVTTLGTAAGSLCAMLYSEWRTGFVMLAPMATGMLGALVSLCAPAAVISETEAVVVGMVGSLTANLCSELLEWLRIDDPCGAIPVHMSSALWGILSVGLFAEAEPCMGLLQEKGLFKGGGASLLLVQFAGIVAISLWSAVTCFTVLVLMRLLSRSVPFFHFLTLRPTRAKEEKGFDETEHAIYRIEQAHILGETEDQSKSGWGKVDIPKLIRLAKRSSIDAAGIGSLPMTGPSSTGLWSGPPAPEPSASAPPSPALQTGVVPTIIEPKVTTTERPHGSSLPQVARADRRYLHWGIAPDPAIVSSIGQVGHLQHSQFAQLLSNQKENGSTLSNDVRRSVLAGVV